MMRSHRRCEPQLPVHSSSMICTAVQLYSKYANVSTETSISCFISNPEQFFLFLICHYLLYCMSYFGCSNHHVQFSLKLYACNNHSCVFHTCFTISKYITIILAVMLKSAILMPKNRSAPYCP